MTLDEYLAFLEEYWLIFPIPEDHPPPVEYVLILL